MRKPLRRVPRRVQTQLTQWSTDSLAILREAGASVLAYELYPLGIATPSTPVMPPLWKSSRAPEVPVVFVHGMLHNPSTFAWIKQKMALAGWKDFRAVSLSTTSHSIPRMAEHTLEAIDRARREFGVEQVDVIAHSMGGILARYALQILNQDGLVRRLVTLGTPHKGTSLSRFSLFPHLRELAPDSATVRRLAQAAPLKKTQAVSVCGSLDVLLWPRDCGRWDGVRHIDLKGVGHAGLLFSKRVVQIILAHLNPSALEPRAGFRLPRLGGRG